MGGTIHGSTREGIEGGARSVKEACGVRWCWRRLRSSVSVDEKIKMSGAHVASHWPVVGKKESLPSLLCNNVRPMRQTFIKRTNPWYFRSALLCCCSKRS